MQVLVDERDLREIEKLALRKLEAVRAASLHTFPTAEINQMLREIETGYGGEPPL